MGDEGGTITRSLEEKRADGKGTIRGLIALPTLRELKQSVER